MVAFIFKMAMFIVIFASMTFQNSLGIVHKVGDYEGWKVPKDPNFYSDWQSNRTFKVFDSLLFGFVTGLHDVSKVDKEGYDKCQVHDPENIIKEGPALIDLTEAGDYYFICSFEGHCDSNQKLAIHVS